MASWSQVKEVLGRALEEPADTRASLLDTLCAGDLDLRAEVESLLAADSAAGAFIDLPKDDPLDGPDPEVGRRVGPYVIERCLGRGGMGAVYLAHRSGEFEQSVAIKMIRRGMDSDLVIRRFRHERQILATLNHPHIARLLDGGTTDDGLPYFVMEYVDGTAIDRYADEHRLDTPERLRLCLAIFDAVQHAHERGIVHRDLKPANVLVTTNGQPKLLDFGIAKILGAEPVGDSTLTSLARPMTPDYASPEQVRGLPITPATDVYALGLLLYELLTGHRPFRFATHTPDEMSHVVCEQEPERPSTAVGRTETTTLADGTEEAKTPQTVSRTRDGSPEALRNRLSGPLDAIVMKALRKTPALRYLTVAAMAGDVRQWLEQRPISAGRGEWRYRISRFVTRRRTALSVAALLALAVVLTTVAVRSLVAPAADASEPASAAARAGRPSIAVAELANLSGRDADRWLATAMAEMLTSELAGGGQVRVVAADRVTRAMRDLAVDISGAAIAAESGQRLRAALASDYLVTGSFATNGTGAARTVRVDLRVLAGADEAIAVSGAGQDEQLFAIMADTGRALRARLGIDANSAAATREARAAFPSSLEATQLYAEGLAHLRVLDAVQAERLLSRAAEREPANPMIHMALSSAWTALGYDRQALNAAQQAFNASGGLTREGRLTIEGRLYEAQREWAKAIDVYRTLWGFFADNVDYGLRLAESQVAAGKSADALTTIAGLRRVSDPQNADPRIDLAESQAAAALADFPMELAALGRAVAHAERTGARLLVARARLLEGRSYFNQGKPLQSEPALEMARQLFAAAGDRAGAAAALNSLGTVLSDQQDITRAQRMYEQSFAVSEEIGDRRAMSSALNNLGILLKDRGDLAAARRAHERALALRREIGDRNWTAISLSNIGVVLFEEDRLREATTYYQQSLAVAREIGDKRSMVRALHNLAIVERETGALAQARAGCEESLAMRAEIGDKRGQVMGRVELGMVLLQQAQLATARKSQEEAIRLAAETRLKPGEAQARYQLGEIALAAGDVVEARRQHQRALALRQEMKETRTILESQLAIAALTLEEGHPGEAAQQARAVMQSVGRTGAPLAAAAALVLARARLDAHDLEAAAEALATARSVAAETARISLRTGFEMVAAEIAVARGQLSEARVQLEALRIVFGRSGMALGELERRLVLVKVDRADRRSAATSDATTLAIDARRFGAGRIARLAETLASSRP